MKRRLSRLDRLFSENPLFFVTFCTHNRQQILANADLHEVFRHFCVAAQSRNILVGRYVIMPDHIHFFVAMGPNGLLSSWIKSLKNSLSKQLREKGHLAPHWQKDFFDHVLRSDSSYDEKWTYVRFNPVRKALVNEPEEWPHQGEVVPLAFN